MKNCFKIKLRPYLAGLLFVFISCNSSSQNDNTMDAFQSFNAKIITTNVSVNSTQTLSNENGILIGGEGRFTIQENVTLDIASKFNVLENKQLFFGKGNVTFASGTVDYINVQWFGAKGDDTTPDSDAIQRAIDAAVYSTGVSVVYFPPGEYLIDKPLLALRDVKKNGKYQFLNLTLRGHQLPYNNPGDGKGGVSVLKANKEIPFVFGVQAARGVHIENMVFDGYIPSKFEIADLIHKTSNDLYPQDRYAPLSAIVIDPFSPEKPEGGGYKGFDEYYTNIRASSRILIENSMIENFPTGISISPNGTTQQGDTVAINFTQFRNLVHGIVICQTQSRNIVVDNCAFGRMKYCFNSEDFGEQNGVLPEVNNIKVADGVAWLYKANGNVAYGHFRNVYAEALYGIGYSVLNKQPLNFESCVFKFRPMTDAIKGDINPCILRADNASFTGCSLIMGGGKKNVEPIIIDVNKVTFINCVLDSEPINIGKNINQKNQTDNLNSGLRPNKLKTSVWTKNEFITEKKLAISYTGESNSYFFENVHGYVVGDFVFGKVAITEEPFQGEVIYTAVGRVSKVEKGKAYFKSELLPKKNVSLKASN